MTSHDLTVLDVAFELNRHPETIREWCREGRFPRAYRSGPRGNWRIPSGDVDDFRLQGAASPQRDAKKTRRLLAKIA